MQRCKLNFINTATPPLRERREGIPLLAAHFLELFNKKFGRLKQLTPPMLAMPVAHAWPGNVRELENIMERFTVLSEEVYLEGGAVGADIAAGRRRALENAGLRGQVAATEREILLNAYRECGSTRKTAQKLGVSQATVVRKLKKYAVAVPPALSGTQR
jgi:TyrR family helix-turn-helix protein